MNTSLFVCINGHPI